MSDQAPSPRFRRIGRLVTLLLFVVCASYLLVTVLTSVLMALYGKPPTLHGGSLKPEDRAYCVRTLVGLRDELEQEVTFVAQPPRPRVDAQARWHAWDITYHERFDAARTRCSHGDEGLTRAYDNLAAMYDGYAGAAKRILDVRNTIAPAVADVVQLLNQDTP